MDASDFEPGPAPGAWRSRTIPAATWIMTDPELRHHDLAVNFARMAEVIGRDFPNIRWVVGFIPLFLHGEAHQLRRRQVADLMARSARELRDTTVTECAAAADRLCVPGQIEIMSQVVWPMTCRILSAVSGTERRIDVLPLLDGSPGLNKYRRLDHDIAEGVADLSERFPDESNDQIGIRIVSSLIAGQALAATIGHNLLAQLRNARATPIGALDWSEQFTVTGVPEVERLAADGCPITLHPGAPAMRSVFADLTLFLTQDPEKNRSGIFGLGAHRCLGAGPAQVIWRQLVSQLRTKTNRVTFLDSAPPEGLGISVPPSIRIEVHNDQQ